MNPAQPVDGNYLLIVEDNPADVGLIRLALKRNGVQSAIHVIEDGEAALAFIDQVESDDSACPSLTVLDLNLPRVSGEEIFRRFRASAKWQRVPVIIVSSSLSARDRMDAIRLGASAYFAKPCELEQFLELGTVIRNMLRATAASGG